MKSRFSVVILSLVLVFCLTVPTFADNLTSGELPETIYYLPKDNVDFALDPELDYLIVGEHQPISTEFITQMLKRAVTLPNDVDGDTIAVENATYTAYTRLRWRLLEEYGIEIGVWDAYRTASDEASISGADDDPSTYAYNEHCTGLLLNVVVKFKVHDPESGEEKEWYYNEAAVRTRDDLPAEVTLEPFEILDSLLADYGFIQRFPEGKEALTGHEYNPNKIRFVGNSTVAHAIMDNHLCLEEYVATLAAP